MKKSVIALSLLLGLSASFTVFAQSEQALRIGTDTTYAPFSSKDAKGEFIGFDIVTRPEIIDPKAFYWAGNRNLIITL